MTKEDEESGRRALIKDAKKYTQELGLELQPKSRC